MPKKKDLKTKILNEMVVYPKASKVMVIWLNWGLPRWDTEWCPELAIYIPKGGGLGLRIKDVVNEIIDRWKGEFLSEWPHSSDTSFMRHHVKILPEGKVPAGYKD